MKKTLVALAALATVGAAFAQSSVTLYGRVDEVLANLTQKTNGVRTADNNIGIQMQGGNFFGLTGSRWGMRGTEDLGNGMRANFVLESGFDPSNGNTQQGSPAGARLFGRQLLAGFSGGWGAVDLGRTPGSPYGDILGNSDAQGYGIGPTGYAFNGPANLFGGSAAAVGVHQDSGRQSNSITYTSPTMSGFTGKLQYVLGENKNAGSVGVANGLSSTNYYAGNLQYANGPIYVGFGYERGNAKSLVASGSDSGWDLGGSYDFGPAKLYAVYEGARSNLAPGLAILGSVPQGGAGRDSGYSIGVLVPVGAFSFSTSYARETTKATGAAVQGKNTAYGLQVQYDLSKRTSLYAHYLDGRSVTAAGVSTKNTLLAAGMQIRF